MTAFNIPSLSNEHTDNIDTNVVSANPFKNNVHLSELTMIVICNPT